VHEKAESARDWLPALNQYRAPNQLRSAFEIGITLVPFIMLWIAAWLALQWSYGLSLLFAVFAAGFLVRLFLIQHDCGHGAFFQRRRANDWTGRVIGVLTFTPYDDWRRSHAVHHATSGNLDRRGIGDITTLTVSEYLARPRWRRLAYRLYRHPLVMFGIGPAYLFLLRLIVVPVSRCGRLSGFVLGSLGFMISSGRTLSDIAISLVVPRLRQSHGANYCSPVPTICQSFAKARASSTPCSSLILRRTS
jgi:hypothetical protein